jgi:superfamily I DNA/RNA helicase
VSTAHKAKGREWPTVRIAGDFPEPRRSHNGQPGQVPRADAMLAYVAVTRARHTLDPQGLAWVEGWM